MNANQNCSTCDTLHTTVDVLRKKLEDQEKELAQLKRLAAAAKEFCALGLPTDKTPDIRFVYRLATEVDNWTKSLFDAV